MIMEGRQVAEMAVRGPQIWKRMVGIWKGFEEGYLEPAAELVEVLNLFDLILARVTRMSDFIR